jgi:glycosyltransferase involved in cell wall biosynthesis
MTMRIHAISRDKGGCMFYRIRVPLMALRDHGHETSWGVAVDLADLDEKSVLVGQMLNGEEDLAFWEAVAAAPHRPLMVYEVDDDLFTMDGVITPEVRGGKPLLWGEPATQARVQRYMALADLVTVTTPHLADLYRPYARRVAVLPNSIPDWVFDLPRAEPDDFVVGWAASMSHQLDAGHIAPALARFFERATTARMHMMGMSELVHVGPDGVRRPGPGWVAPWRATCEAWVGSVPEYLHGLPGKMTVSIAPLGPYQFNKGKSGLKAQEAAALGIPCVAADWAQYRRVMRPTVTGFLAGTNSDWSDYLGRLYRDRALCRRMGTAARDHEATRRASIIAPQWIAAYQEALNGR